MANSAGLQNILQSVLAIGNQEQNFSYAPYVFQSHYNAVTSYLISALVKQYPSNPRVIDMLEPFVVVAKIPVTNGFIQLPALQYRNILGAPYFNLNNGQPCGNQNAVPPIPFNANTFKTAQLTAGCNVVPLQIVPQAEFGKLTTSTYKQPTYATPIGFMQDKFTIKVCPYDLPTATVMFVMQEQPAVYGYIEQPDDTYLYDPTTSVDGLWTAAAFEPIMNGVFALYSAYTRDASLIDFSKVLSQAGIL